MHVSVTYRRWPDHCIDSLRQAIMCHANTAVYTAVWTDPSYDPTRIDLRGDAVTQCVSWDSVMAWAGPRALEAGKYQYIVENSHNH